MSKIRDFEIFTMTVKVLIKKTGQKRKSYQFRGVFDEGVHPFDHVLTAQLVGLKWFLGEHKDKAQKHSRESWSPSQHGTGSNSIICVTLSSAASNYNIIVEINGLSFQDSNSFHHSWDIL